MNERKLNPRQSPKSPPNIAMRSMVVIFRDLVYSENDVTALYNHVAWIPNAVDSPTYTLISAL